MKKAFSILTLLAVIIFSVSETKAQLCGQSFARFIISDSSGAPVPNPTVELLIEISDKNYAELWEKHGHKESGFQPNPFKIPSSIAKGVIKQNLPILRTGDHCGNPLRQTAGKTKVKTWSDVHNDLEGSKESFGFCAREGHNTKYLLKISAPSYITEYYIGSYLAGCNEAWGYSLKRKS